MLKKQRVQRVLDEMDLALSFAKAMQAAGQVDAALLHIRGAMERSLGDCVRAIKDHDDYPPQHRAQFDALVAEVRRLAPGCMHELERGDETKLSVVGRRDGATWAARLVLTEDGVDQDEWSPDHGPISHSGGRVPPDQPPEDAARSLLKAAGVQVPR